MAKINGVIIPKASGSIGNVTFRTSQRQTVASEKIVTNKSNTPAQAEQRKLFKTNQAIAALFRPVAKLAFRRKGWRTAYSVLSSAIMYADDLVNFSSIITTANENAPKLFNLADGEIDVVNIVYTRDKDNPNKCRMAIYAYSPEGYVPDEDNVTEESIRGAICNNPGSLVPYADMAKGVEVVKSAPWGDNGFVLMVSIESYTVLPEVESGITTTFGNMNNIPIPFCTVHGKWIRIKPTTALELSL